MRPYRLHYISDIEGWAYWWIGLALQEYAPSHVTVTLGCWSTAARDALGADVAFNMVYPGTPEFAASLHRNSPQTILVTGFNVGFENRGAEQIPICAKHSAHVIVNNRDTYCEAVQRELLIPERSDFISVGTDLRKFRVRTPVDQRPDKVLFCCSQGHAKWKGADILRAMEPDFHAAGFETDFVVVDSHGKAKFDQQQLADWYQTGRYYVCLSELGMEGTPMPPLEAAASGCVVITTDTGSMPEIMVDDWNGVVLRNREPLTVLAAVKHARDNRERLTANMNESLKLWDWSVRAADYFAIFDRLIRRGE